MKHVSLWILTAFIWTSFLPVVGEAQTGEALYLLSAKDSRVKAQKWIDFLSAYDQPVEHYFLSELDLVKDHDYIAIAGGLDEEGVRDLLVEVLGESEVSSLEAASAGKMFLKKDVWKPGQMVLVFAGKNADEAAEARSESKETWMEYLKDWFELEDIPGGLHAY